VIRNESEYREAVGRLRQERERIDAQRSELEKIGLTAEEIGRALDPIRSFHLQLEEEVQGYERLKRGEFDELSSLRGLGHLLISVRIARGLTQRELAERLGVHESLVSRDERNEYHGITLDRAARILDALGAELRSTVVVREREPIDAGGAASPT
jgi:DNA-binding XRE family transcriptional regulator